jgi:hypothetical protein
VRNVIRGESKIPAREGVELDRSTMADWVGATSQLLEPLLEEVRRYVMTASPLSKDFESLEEARDLAERITEEYICTYVYDDAGELLYEASSYRERAQQAEMLSQEPPQGSKGDPRRTPR